MLEVAFEEAGSFTFDPDNPATAQPGGLKVKTWNQLKDGGKLNVQMMCIEGISVFMISLDCKSPLTLSLMISSFSWSMNFMISGNMNIRLSGAPADTLRMNEGKHYILTTRNAEKISIQVQDSVKLFSVCFTEHRARKLLAPELELFFSGNETGDSDLAWTYDRPITLAMTDIISTVLRCAENNCLHRILLEARILELLFLDVEQFNQMQKPADTYTIKSGDLDRFTQAKALINQNLQVPCSLIELAHKVGLNDFKLKKGFKELFGTTVFGYLFECRMEKAKVMLSTDKFTVNEVANEVGYKNAHHFTAAFKKRFGYLPSQMKKSVRSIPVTP